MNDSLQAVLDRMRDRVVPDEAARLYRCSCRDLGWVELADGEVRIDHQANPPRKKPLYVEAGGDGNERGVWARCERCNKRTQTEEGPRREYG